MTYKDLAKKIRKMTKRQKNAEVLVYDPLDDEYFIAKLKFAKESDVLDKSYPFLDPEED